jgi:nucleotide-binding universal stress UspA family protein
LLDRASCFGADLIVSGGYGRSRIGEWAFGGVTKALLDQAEYFVLLSH